LPPPNTKPPRCQWATRPLEIAYHDNEWGTPCHDDRLLFEYLLLDGMQAGLSWYIMLLKREQFRSAFADFNPQAIARFDDAKVDELMRDEGIVRNRQKISAAIGNARAFLKLQEERGTFASYLWDFVDGRTICNHIKSIGEAPTTSPISDALSADLKQRGFRFVGSTTIYAFMEGAGLYNNHLTYCFRYRELMQT